MIMPKCRNNILILGRFAFTSWRLIVFRDGVKTLLCSPGSQNQAKKRSALIFRNSNPSDHIRLINSHLVLPLTPPLLIWLAIAMIAPRPPLSPWPPWNPIQSHSFTHAILKPLGVISSTCAKKRIGALSLRPNIFWTPITIRGWPLCY